MCSRGAATASARATAAADVVGASTSKTALGILRPPRPPSASTGLAVAQHHRRTHVVQRPLAGPGGVGVAGRGSKRDMPWPRISPRPGTVTAAPNASPCVSVRATSIALAVGGAEVDRAAERRAVARRGRGLAVAWTGARRARPRQGVVLRQQPLERDFGPLGVAEARRSRSSQARRSAASRACVDRAARRPVTAGVPGQRLQRTRRGPPGLVSAAGGERGGADGYPRRVEPSGSTSRAR